MNSGHLPLSSRGFMTHKALHVSASVLIVDDEQAILEILRQFISERGYRVTTAASAKDALALIDAETLRRRARRSQASRSGRPRSSRTARARESAREVRHHDGVRIPRKHDRRAAAERLRLHNEAVRSSQNRGGRGRRRRSGARHGGQRHSHRGALAGEQNARGRRKGAGEQASRDQRRALADERFAQAVRDATPRALPDGARYQLERELERRARPLSYGALQVPRSGWGGASSLQQQRADSQDPHDVPTRELLSRRRAAAACGSAREGCDPVGDVQSRQPARRRA